MTGRTHACLLQPCDSARLFGKLGIILWCNLSAGRDARAPGPGRIDDAGRARPAFSRDIRAGEIAGTVITHAMMQAPEFTRDLQAARVELRQVLGLSAEPEAVTSMKPK